MENVFKALPRTNMDGCGMCVASENPDCGSYIDMSDSACNSSPGFMISSHRGTGVDSGFVLKFASNGLAANWVVRCP